MYTYIRIPWQDGSIPALPRKFWEDLLREIRRLKKDVLISCQGGHGRTGVALSILYGLITGSKTPIGDIRGLYCREAVETHSQVDYVNNILGTDESPKIRKVWSYEDLLGSSRF